MKVLVTGGAGLVGSESCKLFASEGWDVISVDNYTRAKLFGKEAETKDNIQLVQKEFSIEHHEMDIRDDKIIDLVKQVDAVVHTAAQPSHPKSIEIPMEDFQINAYGTLNLLEAVRKYNKEIPFVFCSTNKVYGEAPNYFSYKKAGKRFEPLDPMLQDGFDEHLRIDQMMHTPFGVSKVAADLYCQEYAHLYGLKSAVFRMGCITGGAAKATEMHNWEPFFVKKAISGEELTIFGHGGYQVRDVIHAADLAKLFLAYVKKPRPGEAYNIGGSRKNSLSLLESIDLIELVTGKKMKYKLGPEREADHIWWISNINKAKHHYPGWDIRIGLEEVFKDIYEALSRK
ncbi:MAG: NAD-dependent epimerase/dehydratase family protein [Candidatus Micrarchaeota archaeon]|nr:NAD-dependent epimerase/dehydratase family protein [Candidatus Micrarchaeota archaeon]